MRRVSLFLMVSLLALALSGRATAGEAQETGGAPGTQQEEQFCGTSTGGACTSDQDCVRAGCSKQVCQSVAEPQEMTTCEFRECYDPTRYDLSCACTDGACGWARHGEQKK